MRSKIKFPTLLMFYLAAAFLPPSAQAVDHGQPAPTFELAGVAAETVKLASFVGKVVYVDFWASWCGPCKHSFPWLSEMQSKYGSKGLQIVGVNLDAKVEDGHRFLKANPAGFTVAFDPAGSTPKAYAVKGMPTSYLIGRDGKIIIQHMGFKDGDRAELEKKIQDALEK